MIKELSVKYAKPREGVAWASASIHDQLISFARVLAEGAAVSNLSFNIAESDFVSHVAHFFAPDFPLPSRQLVASQTDKVYVEVVAGASEKLKMLEARPRA